jgi:hypothetical protein
VDREPLTSAHLKVLSAYDDAKLSLLGVCDRAAEAMTNLWGSGQPGIWPPTGDHREYYWNYRLTADDGTTIAAPAGWELGWQLLLDGRDELVDAEDGVPLVTAGLDARPGALARFGEDTLERLTIARLDVLPAPTRAKDWDYIVRQAHLDTAIAVANNDLNAQGQSLAAWIDGSFRAIAEVLRPVSAS